MSFIDPSIYYFNHKLYGQLIYRQLVLNFSIRRLLVTMIFILLHLFMAVGIVFTRLLDEILFPAYRKVDIKNPVFIISNPRSGTTYMHRLLCLDEERFSYMLLFHTICISVTMIKLVGFISFLDRKVGSPLRKIFDWLDDVLFGGWKDIHPMGFNQAEEDEAVFVYSIDSAGVYFLFPYPHIMHDGKFLDKAPAAQRKKMMAFYESTVKRFQYATGQQYTFLSKNVISTGRLQSLMEVFPDSKVIYLIRNPYKAVPSFISMFVGPWQMHSPDIPKNSDNARGWGQLAMDYYKYFQEQKAIIPIDRLITIRYEDLVAQPQETVLKIYKHFGLEPSEQFKQVLSQQTTRSKNYKSTHSYSLEEYGYTKDDIYKELESVFEEFGFER